MLTLLGGADVEVVLARQSTPNVSSPAASIAGSKSSVSPSVLSVRSGMDRRMLLLYYRSATPDVDRRQMAYGLRITRTEIDLLRQRHGQRGCWYLGRL